MTKHDAVNKLAVSLFHLKEAERKLWGTEHHIVDAREHVRTALHQVELLGMAIKPEDIINEGGLEWKSS
jgi:hypothetical protein